MLTRHLDQAIQLRATATHRQVAVAMPTQHPVAYMGIRRQAQVTLTRHLPPIITQHPQILTLIPHRELIMGHLHMVLLPEPAVMGHPLMEHLRMELQVNLMEHLPEFRGPQLL